MAHQRRPLFSVCILTRNRPEELRRAIESVLSSPHPVHQVIVSDNSTDDRTRAMVTADYPQVTYMEGPRQGLSSNRNNALSEVTGTHVLMMDDDAVLGAEFLGKMAAHIGRAQMPHKLILTGVELQQAGKQIMPHKMDFFGFQSLSYTENDKMDSIVMNSTVFPTKIFQDIKFDSNLIYGYDENDFVMRAVYLHGYKVQIHRDAINYHFPLRADHGSYANQVEANRIYVTFKKYFWMERRRGKAFLYLVLAYSHNLLHELKMRRTSGFVAFGRTFRVSVSNILACSKDKATYV